MRAPSQGGIRHHVPLSPRHRILEPQLAAHRDRDADALLLARHLRTPAPHRRLTRRHEITTDPPPSTPILPSDLDSAATAQDRSLDSTTNQTPHCHIRGKSYRGPLDRMEVAGSEPYEMCNSSAIPEQADRPIAVHWRKSKPCDLTRIVNSERGIVFYSKVCCRQSRLFAPDTRTGRR